VAAPLERIGLPAARLRPAAPLVREEQLGTVVAERRRVPEGHVRVGDGEKTFGILRLANVEQQTVARTRAAGVADVGVRRDVMTAALSDDVASTAAATSTATTSAARGSRRGRVAAAASAAGRRGIVAPTCTA